MIDCHCHLLPGMDDGPKTIDESVEIARILADAGFREVYCTPHMIKGAFDNSDAERLKQAVAGVQSEIDRHSIPLRLRAGLEYYMDEFLPSLLDEALTFAGSGLLMIEAPSRATQSLVKESIYQIVRRGYTPLLAHVERYEFVGLLADRETGKTGKKKSLFDALHYRFARVMTAGQGQKERGVGSTILTVEELCSTGCLFQGNIGSFAGIYGERIRERAVSYLEKGLYNRLGSDAHRSSGLAEWLERGMQTVRNIAGEEGLRRLTGKQMCERSGHVGDFGLAGRIVLTP